MLGAVNGRAQPDDSALMKRVAEGDQRAFLELYDRYANKVYGLALYILGDRMAAEEISQDAFLRLWTRAETFNPSRGKLTSWLLTVTRRLAVDRIRLDSRRPRIIEHSNSLSALAHLPDPKTQTEEARWASLRFALDDLPDEQRSVIELAYYQGLSQAQIAEHLELPLGTVKTRIRLGMDKLRRAWLTDPNLDPERTRKREEVVDESRD